MPDGSTLKLGAGLHAGIAMLDYLRLPAVGAHDLWALHTDCPAVARYGKDHPNHETAAKSLGTAMHTLTLEPDAFAARYAVRPVGGPRGNSNEYKAWAAEHIAAGREIVAADEWAQMQAMRAALPRAARKLLAKGKSEVTALVQHEDTGLMLRTRPDWLRDEGIIVDVKTAADPRPAAWARQAANLGYHASAALCADIMRELTGEVWEIHFLVMGKDAPFISYLATLDPVAIETGRQLYHGALQTWAACEQSGEWPDYGPVVNVSLPAWALPKPEEVA